MEEKGQNDIWIISGGRAVNLDLSSICGQTGSNPVTEYRISELARYLLSPNPISVEDKLIGCRIKYKTPSATIIEWLKSKSLWKKGNIGSKAPYIEEILSTSRIGFPLFNDEDLNRHFIKINELLRVYDPAQKKIAGLDRKKLEDITAICEDIGGNRYQMSLQGDIEQKISYVRNSLSRLVNVVFKMPYQSTGLFEMRGFRFPLFNPHIYYHLIKFTQDNQTRYCVLNDMYQLEYWVKDHELINFIHMFEQSIRTDPKLREALTLCIKGEAKPLKLFFPKKLDQNYTGEYLPMAYRGIIDIYKMNDTEKAVIANMLNNHQRIVSFNYVPKCEAGRQKLCINISVLHDVKAIEPIRNLIPQLYSEIDKKAPFSDIGKLYLLDSLRGFQYV